MNYLLFPKRFSTKTEEKLNSNFDLYTNFVSGFLNSLTVEHIDDRRIYLMFEISNMEINNYDLYIHYTNGTKRM